jgi:Domain of unknown function (DUF4386)
MTLLTPIYEQNMLPAQQGIARAAIVCIATALLSFAPLMILGSAIGWPASLGKPAAEQLAAIARTPQAVATGYGVYLLYSVLVLPVMVLAARRIFGSLASAGAVLVVGFAALSVLARSAGILRWLTVMPALAQQHAVADATTRSTIELVFQAVTLWGGGIGELLGVSLFMGLSLGLAMLAAWRLGSMPRWLSLLGLLAAALLLGLFLPAVGVAVKVPVAAAVTMLSVWMLALGVWFWFAAKPN